MQAGATGIENITSDLVEPFRLPFARSYLIDFTTTTFPEYQVKWYHELLCNKCDALLRGDIKRLMVFLPPQRGKSELVSLRFPAYALGKKPSLKIAACSYSSDLAEKFNREVQRIIDSPEYAQIFPKTMLNNKNIVSGSKGAWLRNSSIFETVKYGGIYKSVGVMGPLTGNKVDLGIIDDPIKDQLEAQSQTFRNRLWEWYMAVFTTRLHNGSRILLTMTRWHEDDLAGRLLEKEGDRWSVLSFPELKEYDNNPLDPRKIGEPLWPERHSLESTIDIQRKSERVFASMYQQRPAPSEGNIIKDSWIRYFTQPPRVEKIIQSWDFTFEGKETSDYVACTVWGKADANYYLLYMLRGKWDFVQSISQIKYVCSLFPQTSEKVIEAKANGSAIISFLQKEINGLIPFSPGTDSKEARAYACSFLFEAGNVYFPQYAPWLDDVRREISVFPNGKNDDIVDTITQALLFLTRHNGAMVFHTGFARQG